MRTLFTLFFLHALTVAIAQKSYLNPVFKNEREKNVVRFMESVFDKNYNYQSDTICLRTVFYAVFEISETGKIANLKFTTSLPESARPLVEQMIYATEGCWQPAKYGRKAVRSRPFMLPVYCQFVNDDCVEVKDMQAPSAWFMFRYDKTKPRIGGFWHYDVDATFDGIVLHPARIGNDRIIDRIYKFPR